MSEVKHTALPFATANNGVSILSGHDIIATTNLVSGPTGLDESSENAEFIVRACNSHYDMLEALEALVGEVEYDVLSELKSGRPVPPSYRNKLEAARSALKKARGLK